MEIKGIKITPPQPEKKEEVVLKIVCDLCRVSEGRSMGSGKIEWKTETYWEQARTTLSCEVGTVYPESGTVFRDSFHICPECWHAKLVPWLESQDAKSTELKIEH